MDWNNPVLVWIIVAVAFFILEIATPTIFVFACFGIGALGASLAFKLFSNIWLSWIVFIAISIVGVIASRPLAEKFAGKSARLAHIDAIIGKKGKVVIAIDPEKDEGRVMVDREDWRAEADERIEPGEIIEVLKVEGTHLYVKKPS
ncbi:MAG: NfeD family protein [Elusimicrobia bacterium]|nr:NfeD family protein [Elusimicrobiota bacterium]